VKFLKINYLSLVAESRDIVSPHKTIRGMNKSIPRMESTGIEYPLKTKIRHKTQNVNAKHFQCQCTASGRSCGPSPYFFGIYLFFSGPQFERTGSENLEQSL